MDLCYDEENTCLTKGRNSVCNTHKKKKGEIYQCFKLIYIVSPINAYHKT